MLGDEFIHEESTKLRFRYRKTTQIIARCLKQNNRKPGLHKHDTKVIENQKKRSD